MGCLATRTRPIQEDVRVATELSGVIHGMALPFTVSPSGGGLAVFAAEERFTAYAILIGYTPSMKAPEAAECVALVTVRMVAQLIYGHPNEESYCRDPRGGLSHGIYEIEGSGWLDSIDAYNRVSIGTDYSAWNQRKWRHFFVGSKDSSAQFLAESVELETFTVTTTLRDTYRHARTEALNRLDSYPEP